MFAIDAAIAGAFVLYKTEVKYKNKFIFVIRS